jgi:hypothetical protein
VPVKVIVEILGNAPSPWALQTHAST